MPIGFEGRWYDASQIVFGFLIDLLIIFLFGNDCLVVCFVHWLQSHFMPPFCYLLTYKFDLT